eukprot:361322-Chlamydomonas_euryale.AAC.2
MHRRMCKRRSAAAPFPSPSHRRAVHLPCLHNCATAVSVAAAAVGVVAPLLEQRLHAVVVRIVDSVVSLPGGHSMSLPVGCPAPGHRAAARVACVLIEVIHGRALGAVRLFACEG